MLIWIAIGAAVLAAAAIPFLRWTRYRGQMLITCPENQRPAGVRLDARSAALPNAPLHLSNCSRWPEKAGCGQECLRQIEQSPEHCLVRNIAADWYQGKTCASCGQAFGEIRWDVQQPALRDASGVTTEWKDVPVERLPEILVASQPVCFACHMAAVLVRDHPQLAVPRQSRP